MVSWRSEVGILRRQQLVASVLTFGFTESIKSRSVWSSGRYLRQSFANVVNSAKCKVEEFDGIRCIQVFGINV